VRRRRGRGACAGGLEFGHVVVVEPAAIVEEGGLRELYVALTRPTKALVVLHERPLPAELAHS
jgi:DNA helicase IV